MTTLLITVVFAWWSDASDSMLLAHYGYDSNGISESEFYRGVSQDNMARVKSLENRAAGIGWPVKAALTYVLYMPYLLVVYAIAGFVKSSRKKSYSRRVI